MSVTVPAKMATFSFIDGAWHQGNVGILGPLSHAIWQGSSVFDGARAFEGVCPDLDLHLARVNRSAKAIGLRPFMDVPEMIDLVKEGVARFHSEAALYIRPMYWAEHPGEMGVSPDPESTRFCLCLHEAPLPSPVGISLAVSTYRRPTIETMPTDAKTGSLYPNNARAVRQARQRGYDSALVLDALGNVAETATSNLFLVKENTVFTPVENGCFLAGITRSRVTALLKNAGVNVVEKSLTVAEFLAADEVFSTGNYMKVVPIIRIEQQAFPIGPIGVKARTLYWEWAHATG